MAHEPNLDRMPDSLRSLAWQPMDLDREWSDGQTLLVAVPVTSCNDWYYDLAIVRIECDEDCFRVTEADEEWGWDLSDADYFVDVSK